MVRLIERFFPALVALTLISLIASTGLIFFYAPVEAVMGIVQKIFYIHVPAAMATYAGFLICSVASIIYLVKPDRFWDAVALSGAETGMVFCLFVLISGPLWGYKAWGKPWVWDAQLTATFVLFVLYAGYIILRTLSANTHTMRLISSVLAIVACVNIPIIHYAARKWEGMHPVVERAGGNGLAPAMKTTFSVSMLAFLLLFACLFWLCVRTRIATRQLDDLSLDVQDYQASLPA